MDDAADGQDGESADLATKLGFPIVDIVPDGDILLDVTFETSKETLKAARKAAKPRPGQKVTPPVFKARNRVGYRVQLSALKQNSKYFDNLLSDTRFAEARSIEESFQRLSLKNVKPSEADAGDLPLVKIHEDDEATRSAGHNSVFEDLLRILHRKQSTAKAVTMQHLAVLALLADRFNCIAIVSRYLNALKYKWPATQTRVSRDDGPTLSRATEETLRQKILVAWLLDQPPKLQVATRELIMYGSRRWSEYLDEEQEESYAAAWWDLPDDLEQELHHRRERILTTIASIQTHFLGLYTSRTRQCKLGYDSSASCDSYQLGEMIKFLCSRNLLFLTSFTPSPFLSPSISSSTLPETPDISTTDIGSILATLKQCPAYQIDKNHTHCGLRARALPAVEYVQAMLASGAVAIARPAWVRDREGAAWRSSLGVEGGHDGDGKRERKVFRFTRGLATDQRLRMEGAMAVDRSARALFTADEWDWSTEDRDETRGVEFGRWPAAR
ncbi:hypothetical protein CHGG_08213 [Chaetomium globosum CBS 148.51]|uniref:Uncharacterized protein n=1 Tax=Chaetomium globosum (strain ATCC 6205 / CBS 148.51 / DSM 1962 / NBRC 6347 / NRRL 1970) TaxID=306901 RepID=Q2GUZ1_CHAGB|nr:uncharacterized protein CHGG_08213 [Chaetomium globosum CBS 148.51]EAQ86960.1 hypothetical protein CHGG_08213 [Chaetomium globosum CBS 148.51]